MNTDSKVDIDETVKEYGLEHHLKELDEVGLTVVSQETLRRPDEWFDRVRDAILRVGKERTGVEFDLASSPSVKFKGRPGVNGRIILSHMVLEGQEFADVSTHPVKKALMTYLLGEGHRLLASDGWIKWQTPDTWEEEVSTGFHVDQNMVPPPFRWQVPHVANMNWTLTDYTREDGALAYVPGSHKEDRPPELGEALPRAIPVEAPKGSLIIFHGALWHGAYRKTTPGLRVTMLGQHCRPYMLPAQDYKGRLSEEAFNASEDPEYLRSLVREDETDLRVEPFGAAEIE